MKSWSKDLELVRAVAEAQEGYSKMMREIAIDAYQRAELARRLLLKDLRSITGEDQPDPGNPYREVR